MSNFNKVFSSLRGALGFRVSCIVYNMHELEEFELSQYLELLSLLEFMGLSFIQRFFLNNRNRIAVLLWELDRYPNFFFCSYVGTCFCCLTVEL